MIVEEEKIMKLFVKVITSIALFITSLLFCLSITTNKIITDDISSLLASKLDINGQINKVLSSFSPFLNQDTSLTNIINQDKTNEMIQKYTPIILQDLAGNENHENYDMNTDLQDILLDNMSAFKAIMKNTLTDTQKEQIIKAAIYAIDMQSVYDNIIDNAKARLSSQEVFIIQIASFLIADSTMMVSGLLTFVFGAIICFMEYRQRRYSYLPSVSFICSALTIFLLFIASKQMILLQTIDFSLLLTFSIGYTIIAIALFGICKHLNVTSTS